MSKSKDITLEQIKLNLSDYQTELSAIDEETVKEKERILSDIQSEEIEIKSLLEQYRNIKRQKEVEVVKTSYNNLSNFKKALLSKIKSETEGSQVNLKSTVEGGEPKKSSDAPEKYQSINQKVKVIELINFIEGTKADDLVKLYPADIARIIPTFEIDNTVVKDGLLKYYQKNNNVDIYDSLLKLYQKPKLDEVKIPDVVQLSVTDGKYHNFLQAHYPKSLPFFWFLVDREKDSIRHIVMEFAVDHIIQTNTLDRDPNRQELTLDLSELLQMNNNVPLAEFLRDLFLCFHPHRVSQKNNSKNKYFEYINKIIKSQSTLKNPEVLQNWNYMVSCGYNAVSASDFAISGTSQSDRSASQDGLL